jgi:dCMP deaminase
MTKWDIRFLELARFIALWSKDPSTQVGAVVVDNQRRVIGVGFNGFARGVDDAPERYEDRPTKYKMVVHAEVNAILNCSAPTAGATLYVWPAFATPNICHECTKVAIQAGIRRIAGPIPEAENDRWTESIGFSRTMLEEAGVAIDAVDMNARSV